MIIANVYRDITFLGWLPILSLSLIAYFTNRKTNRKLARVAIIFIVIGSIWLGISLAFAIVLIFYSNWLT